MCTVITNKQACGCGGNQLCSNNPLGRGHQFMHKLIAWFADYDEFFCSIQPLHPIHAGQQFGQWLEFSFSNRARLGMIFSPA